MRCDAPSTMRIVKKEHKEAQMSGFVADHVAQTDGAARDAVRCFLLVIRSCDSPVVRALAGLAPQLAKAGVSIKGIIATSAAGASVAWPDDLAPLVEARWLTDPRLLDAHEQLWIDHRTSWTGDCMRREPDKRDAYECFAADSTETARAVASAFRKMWEKATPAPATAAGEEAAEASLDAHVTSSAAAPDGQSHPVASTRH